MLLTAILLTVPFQLPPPQPDSPVQIRRVTVRSTYVARRIGREPAQVLVEAANISGKAIKGIEMQIDIIDDTRRTLEDRLFVKLGDIDSGKIKRFTNELGNYRLPSSFGGEMICGTDCLSKALVNVVHFKDGSTWERKGWRDEPNPNRPQ